MGFEIGRRLPADFQLIRRLERPLGLFDVGPFVLDSSRTLIYPYPRGQDGISRQNRMRYRGWAKKEIPSMMM
jgi:hypothetical protein